MSSRHDEVIAAARASILLANLASDDLELTLDEATYREVEPQSTLLHEGSDRVVILISGSAKRWSTSPRGDRIVMQILGPGQACGLIGVLGHPGVAGEIDTLEPSATLTLPGPHVRRLIDVAPSVARACLRAVTAELAAVRIEQSRLAGGSARDRIVARLLLLADQFGVEHSDYIRIELPLTQDDLASWAGISRESAARSLHELRSRKIVRTARRQIVIDDIEALRALTYGQASRATSAKLILSLRKTAQT